MASEAGWRNELRVVRVEDLSARCLDHDPGIARIADRARLGDGERGNRKRARRRRRRGRLARGKKEEGGKEEKEDAEAQSGYLGECWGTLACIGGDAMRMRTLR